MLFEVFAFGSLMFWAALAVPFLFLCYFVFNEKGSWSTFTVFATIAGIVLFSNLPVLPWLHSLSAMEICFYVGAYILIGFIYMVLKWTYNSFEIKSKYADFRADFLKTYSVDMTTGTFNAMTMVPPPGTKDFEQFSARLLRETRINFNDLPPKIRNHRSELIFWASYWHLSLLFTLLGNPLRHLTNFILNLSSTPLNWVSAKMFASYDELNK